MRRSSRFEGPTTRTATSRSEARPATAARVFALVAVFMALCATVLVAQQAPRMLTLDEAVDIAQRNNPGYLTTANDQAAADWGVRQAYSAFLPTVSASVGGGYQAKGEVRFGTITLDNQTTDWLQSSYRVGFNWNLNGNTIFGVSNARASRSATEATIEAAEFNLESAVAAQYMSVLRAQEGVDVAQRQLDRSEQNAQIVRTRVAAGAAAGTDGTQAEVELGRARVQLIQAERDLRQARLMLGEQLGVGLEDGVELSSEFEVFEPSFELEDLMTTAMTEHPSLLAFREREHASRAQARATTTSQYLPTINVNGGISAYSQEALNNDYVLGGLRRSADSQQSNCEFYNALENGLNGGLPGYTIQDCSQFVVTPEMQAAALAQNSQFPFDFTRNPFQVGLTISLPIFTGFSRQLQVSQANNQAHDAELNRRAEELRLRTQVTNAYDNLESAYLVVQAESRNRELAQNRLDLEQRRYALGASDLLQLLDAETSLSTAEQSYLNAVYDFHYNLIALEAAVGEPLRPS
ncbi:MAG: TolC family protein [Gemmatimonadota bacterium]